MSPFQTAVTHESKIFSANFCCQWLMDPTFTQKWSNFYNESGVIHDDTHSVQVSLWGSAMHRSSCLQVHIVFEPFPRLQNVETLSLLHWRPSFLVLHTIVNDQHHIFQVSFLLVFGAPSDSNTSRYLWGKKYGVWNFESLVSCNDLRLDIVQILAEPLKHLSCLKGILVIKCARSKNKACQKARLIGNFGSIPFPLWTSSLAFRECRFHQLHSSREPEEAEEESDEEDVDD